MRIGLYGGTFDPVHLGHVNAAASVRDHLDLDRVQMILSARPGHRDQPETQNQHRWQMLQMVCAEHEGLVADDSELRRPGKSYAIDTLRQVREQWPDAQLCWILGMDSYQTLPTWEKWRELLNYCHLVVVQRPEYYGDTNSELMDLERDHQSESIGSAQAGCIVFLRLPMQNISSSQVRGYRHNGRSAETLLDHRVWSYIKQHDLYPPQEG